MEFQLAGDLMKFDKADYKGGRVLFDLSTLAEPSTFKSFATCEISQSRLKLHHMKYPDEKDFTLPILVSIIIVSLFILHERNQHFFPPSHFLSPPRPTDPLLLRFPATALPPSDQFLPPSDQFLPPSYQALLLRDQALLRSFLTKDHGTII